MSEVLNQYLLETEFQNQNAGFSRWAFAVKGGEKYFIKEFIDPVYPMDDSLDERLRMRRIADCREYENRKTRFYSVLNENSDGNIVRIQELFRADSHYYIVMPRIEKEIPLSEIVRNYSFEDRVLLCRIVAHSMMQIHKAHIVHADIKDTNVLVHESAGGKLVGKVIDFDCGFFEDEVPESEEDLGGDQIYLAPEACLFLCGESVKLSCKMDVFSLGLLFHQYLVGELPGFDEEEYDYAHEAVLDDQELKISERLPEELQTVLHKMLQEDPDKRCTMAEVYSNLGIYLTGKQTGEDKKTTKKEKTEIPKKTRSGWFTRAGDL